MTKPGTHIVEPARRHEIDLPNDLSTDELKRFRAIVADIAESGIDVTVRTGEYVRLYLIEDRIVRRAAAVWSENGEAPTTRGSNGIHVKNPLVIEMSRALEAGAGFLDAAYRPPIANLRRKAVEIIDDEDDLDLDFG